MEDKLASIGVWRRTSYSHKHDEENPDIVDAPSNIQPLIGSLEPPLGVLDLLFSEDAIKDDIDYILSEDPLTSLFNFELGKLKPPPPPPPPPPPKPPKPKRDRKAEAERRKLYLQAKAAEAQKSHTVLDISPGFRAPRTRKGLAAAAAFEAEAHGEGVVRDDVDLEGGSHLDPAERHSRKEAAKQRIRRPPTVLPGQAEVPPIVDEIDNRQSFKMFDGGWILPENAKRGGRTVADRPPMPPPRKKVKLSSYLALVYLSTPTDHSSDPENSRSSVLSATTSENRALNLLIEDSKETDKIMDVDSSPLTMSPENSPPKFGQSNLLVPQRNIIQNPDGTIIVETLDTPALRRQKSMARKAARLAQAQAAASSSAGPSGVRSVSSSLTDLDVDEEDNRKPRPISSAPPKDPADVILADGETLEGGTLGTLYSNSINALFVENSYTYSLGKIS